jgi:hypothetical protein
MPPLFVRRAIALVLLVSSPACSHASKRAGYPANTPPDSTLHIDVELVQIRPK